MYQIEKRLKIKLILNKIMDFRRDASLERKSVISKNNRIRLNLFSLAQEELNEKKKDLCDTFSFSCQTVAPKEEKLTGKEPKLMVKKNSIGSQITLNDSSDMSGIEEDSSDMSCEEEEI